MADALGNMVRRLRQTCAAPVSELSDAELLSHFVESADPAAFELLTWRHGPLVWGVCRRVLRHEQDAEDAFQATFLVLVRKAATIGRRESVGGWLYKVAFRAALAARAAASKRSSHERVPAEKSCIDPADEAAWHELEPLIDEAIDGLPERYRVAFVLCCVQGLTLQQAAAQLGCPRGTVATRVRRAREQLRARLARHGVALSVGMLSGLVARNAARAAVPRVLLTATWQGVGNGVLAAPVAGLTHEVLRIMSVQKLFVLVATVILALGGGALAYWKLTPTPQPTGPVSAHSPATRAPAAERAGVALAQARTAARDIADPDKRIMLLDEIACEQARVGLFDAAAATLREALRVALDS